MNITHSFPSTPSKSGYAVLTLILLTAVLMVGYGGFLGFRSYSLLTSGARAQGIVKEVKEEQYVKKGKNRTRYISTIEFRDQKGVSHLFTDKQSYAQGAVVEVLYFGDDPAGASVSSFNSLWLTPLLLSFLGGIFATFMVFGIRAMYHRGQEIAWLHQFGRRVQGTVIGVNTERHSRQRGRSYETYSLVVQWEDPISGRDHRFISDTSRKEPGPEIIGTKIDVLFNPEAPKVHLVVWDGA